jgi:hypothetical protein
MGLIQPTSVNMPNTTLVRQRLHVIFLVGFVLFFSPLVLQLEALGRWLGVPVLLIYLYAVWGAIIALAAVIVSRGRD